MKNLKQSIDFMANFYPNAKKIIYLLEKIEQLNAEEFGRLHLNIELSLKQYNNEYTESSPSELSVPIQQLAMINQILPPLYDVLHQREQHAKSSLSPIKALN